MRVVTPDEFRQEQFHFYELIRNGAVFIYPTDTIYGLGCNALAEEAVRKIRKIKQRFKNPFSVIAPSKEWIGQHCLTQETKDWKEKLPGPYTFIFKTKKPCVASDVNAELMTLGVRIPNHWIATIIYELAFPIVSTSVNLTGQEFMTSLDDLDEQIKQHVDFIIYEGPKKGRPSIIIDYTKKAKVITR